MLSAASGACVVCTHILQQATLWHVAHANVVCTNRKLRLHQCVFGLFIGHRAC
jgi:hypothetical protein